MKRFCDHLVLCSVAMEQYTLPLPIGNWHILLHTLSKRATRYRFSHESNNFRCKKGSHRRNKAKKQVRHIEGALIFCRQHLRDCTRQGVHRQTSSRAPKPKQDENGVYTRNYVSNRYGTRDKSTIYIPASVVPSWIETTTPRETSCQKGCNT